MPTIQDLRQTIPELKGLDDSTAVEYIRRIHYPDRTAEEIGSRLGVKPVPPEQKRGKMRALADLGLGVGQGAVQGVRMLTDVAGADNVVSGGLRKVEDFIGGLQSATVKDDQQEIGRILKEAEGAGVLDQVVAGAKAFAVSPAQTTAHALGTMAPTVAAAFLPFVGQGALAARFAAGGIGAAQGVGAVKGAIYDEVGRAHEAAGMSVPDAQARAAQAQSYGSGNFSQLALGGVLGAVAGGALPGIGGGVEGAVRGMVRGSQKSSLNAPARVLAYGAAEAAPEFAQGAQEKYATNTAVGGEGFDVKPTAGMVAAGTMEGLAGFGMGGAVGALNRRAPKVPEGGPLSRGANIATDLEVPPAPPPPPTPPIALTPEQDAGLMAHANKRAAALAEKAKGTKPHKMPDGTEMSGKQPEFLTPAEKTEQAFLNESGGDVQALARAYQLSEAEAEADAAIARVESVGKNDQAGMRVFGRESQAQAIPLQPAQTVEAEPRPIPQPPAFEPDLNTPAAIYEALGEIEQRNAQTRQMYAPLAGDVLNKQGQPFTTMPGAKAAQKKAGEGFEIVRVADGLVVRKESASVDQRNVAAAPARLAGSGDAGGAEAARSGAVVGLVPDAPGRVDQPAVGIEPGNRADRPVADGRGPDAALSGQPAAPKAADMPPADANVPALKHAWRKAVADGRADDATAINDRIVALKATTKAETLNVNALSTPAAGPAAPKEISNEAQSTQASPEARKAREAAKAPVVLGDAAPTASWVIREKATGAVVAETFDKKKVAALNTAKYEAVPIQEHLAGMSKPADAAQSEDLPTLKAPKAANVIDIAGDRQLRDAAAGMRKAERDEVLHNLNEVRAYLQTGALSEPDAQVVVAELQKVADGGDFDDAMEVVDPILRSAGKKHADRLSPAANEAAPPVATGVQPSGPGSESTGTVAAAPTPKTQKSVNTQPVVAPEKTAAPASDQQVPPADDGAAPRRTIERAGLDRRLSALQDLRACLSA